MYREFFPVAGRLTYLNHAAIAPLCRPAAEAMEWLARDAMEYGSLHYPRWLETYEGLRQSAARLINGTPQEIAILKNTSEGLATIAMGLEWRAGDRIVAFKEEFPANQYPWRRLESKGVRIEWLNACDPLDRIDEAARDARLLAISFVQFLTGFRADLRAIGEICNRRGVIFVVDAIQGLGAFPVDVQEAHIDALAADGHKWMFGPEGCAILFISKRLQEMVEPVEFGWTNVAGYEDYGSRDMTLRPDAGRYECGTLNTISCFGLRAALDFLLEIGVDRIAPLVQGLGDRIARGVERKGYEVLGSRTPENGAGIVSFRKRRDRGEAGGGLAAKSPATGANHGNILAADVTDSEAIVSKLRGNAVVTAARAGWVRASPHFYVDPEQIEKMIDLLP